MASFHMSRSHRLEKLSRLSFSFLCAALLVLPLLFTAIALSIEKPCLFAIYTRLVLLLRNLFRCFAGEQLSGMGGFGGGGPSNGGLSPGLLLSLFLLP